MRRTSGLFEARVNRRTALARHGADVQHSRPYREPLTYSPRHRASASCGSFTHHPPRATDADPIAYTVGIRRDARVRRAIPGDDLPVTYTAYVTLSRLGTGNTPRTGCSTIIPDAYLAGTLAAAYAHDLPEFGHEGLVKARNAYSASSVTSRSRRCRRSPRRLPATWKGGGAFKGRTARQPARGQRMAGFTASPRATATAGRRGVYSANWFFAQFGDLVVCQRRRAAEIHDSERRDSGQRWAEARRPVSYGAIVKDFVFLAGNSSNQNRVYWSAINNAEGWTVGDQPVRRSGLARWRSDYGLAGGEFGLAFQDEAIHIFEYVGTPAIFTRRKVSNSIGALCHGSIAQHGRQTFFYSRRGFYKFIDGEVVSDRPQQGRSHVPHHLLGLGDRQQPALHDRPRTVAGHLVDARPAVGLQFRERDVERRSIVGDRRDFDGRTASSRLRTSR
jgi:hypothetical protein